MYFISGSTLMYRHYNQSLEKINYPSCYQYIDLHNYIDNQNTAHINQIKTMFRYFNQKDYNKFLTDNLCMAVIEQLPSPSEILVLHYEGIPLNMTNHQTLLNGYNKLYDTGFQLKDI